MAVTITPRELVGDTWMPDTAAAAVYTSPSAATKGIIEYLTVLNTDDVNPQTFSLWTVPNGGSPNDGNIIADNVALAAGAIFTEALVRVIEGQAALFGLASVAVKLAVSVHGVEHVTS